MIEPHHILVGGPARLGGRAPCSGQADAVPHGEHRVRVVGVYREQHWGSSTRGREDVASRDTPEFSGDLEQQRTFLIYVDEPAVQGSGPQPHPDRLAERHSMRPPRRAYRREAVLAPASHPELEVMGELLDRVRRRDVPQTL